MHLCALFDRKYIDSACVLFSAPKWSIDEQLFDFKEHQGFYVYSVVNKYGEINIAFDIFFLFFYRTTAFGFLNALCKLAAVLGISIFQSFVGITKAVPILFASGALAAGSFLALKLPETRGQVLQ